MDDSYSRVGSTLSLPDVIQTIVQSYAIGDVMSVVPILTGYQDYNVDITTTQGRFVIKIFSKEKSKERIDDVLWGYTTFADLGVPTPKPLHTIDKQFYMEIKDNTHIFYACIFPYIIGKTLTRTPITDTDLVALTKTLITIHTTPHPIHHYYDTLSIVNLPAEYTKKQHALTPDEVSFISPIITKLHKLKLDAFPQSIIHGSMEKENVLKNMAGNIFVLDFGCMDYNATITDIAAFIANFTLYVDPIKRSHIIHLILDTYQTSRKLTSVELSALLTLIRSQYAAYVVGMSFHMRIEHDMTKQTQTWLDRGWDGLRTYADVKKIL